MTITSPHNEKLKTIRKLTQRRRERERSGWFVAEGEDLLAAADAAGWEPVHRLCAAGSGLAGEEVEPGVLASVSGLGSGTRTLGVYEERWAPVPLGPLCVALYGVGDPGNIGTVLRSARAFGASVALGANCADPFSPKAVRASMGAIFEVALARVDTVAALPGQTVALAADAGPTLSQVDLREVTLLIGAERDGLPDEVLAAADATARIPIASHSLNAAMAATVALYEASRITRA
ncbi:MAG: RNA methyltransferase [Actinomycetota bacterium]|nr:RNA methyltransferase [Actinomycetota bacterium]